MLKSKDRVKIKVQITIHSAVVENCDSKMVCVQWKRGERDSKNGGKTTFEVVQKGGNVKLEELATVECSVFQDQKTKKFEPKRMDFYIIEKGASSTSKGKTLAKGATDLGAYANPGTYSSQSLPLKTASKSIPSASVLLSFHTTWLKINNKILEKAGSSTSSSSSTSEGRNSISSPTQSNDPKTMEFDGEEYYLRTADDMSVDDFSDAGSTTDFSDDDDEGSLSEGGGERTTGSSFSRKIRESVGSSVESIRKDTSRIVSTINKSGGKDSSASGNNSNKEEILKLKERNKKLKLELATCRKELELCKKRLTRRDIQEISEELKTSSTGGSGIGGGSGISIGEERNSVRLSSSGQNNILKSLDLDPTPFIYAVERAFRRVDHENNGEMIHFLGVTTTLYDCCEKEYGVRQDMAVSGIPINNDPMNYSDEDNTLSKMSRSLELLIYDIYSTLWSNIQNQLDNSIIPSMLEVQNCIWDTKRNTEVGGGRKGGSISTRGNDVGVGGGLVGSGGQHYFSNLYRMSKQSFVLESVIKQLIHQLFYYLNCRLFNTLLHRPDLCTYSGGFQLKLGLSQTEDSLTKTDKKVLLPLWNKHLLATKEASNVLLLDKTLFEDRDAVLSAFSLLNPLQIKTLLDSFSADQLSGVSVSSEARRVLDELLVGRKFPLELDSTGLLDLPMK